VTVPVAFAVVLTLAALVAGGGAWLLRLRRTWLVVDVIGESMAPTFVGGDRVLVRLDRTGGLCVGDVVVYGRSPHGDDRPPTEPDGPAMVVKRVAALPGDPMPDTVDAGDGGTTVPPGRLVLLGDNADWSVDSRMWGPVHLEGVRGVVVRRMAPRGGRPAGRNVPTST
jgi:signal peptidase I